MKRHIVGGILCLAILGSLLSPAGAFEPASDVLPGSPPSAQAVCALSTDGAWTVTVNDEADGWVRWSAEAGARNVGGSTPISAVRISDNGNWITSSSWGNQIGDDVVHQIDVSSGQVRTIVDDADHIEGLAVATDGSRVTWVQQYDQTGPDTWRVRRWSRATNQITTIDSHNETDLWGSRLAVTSPNGRYLRVSWDTRTTTTKVYDTTTGTSFDLAAPSGLSSELAGISNDGQRFLWFSAGIKLTVTDRNGSVVASQDAPHALAFMNDVAVELKTEIFFAADGGSAVLIGGQRVDAPPGDSQTVVYRWTVGGDFEAIDIADPRAEQLGFASLAEHRTSLCAASADLRFVINTGQNGATIETRRYDLSRQAPRQVDRAEVTGPQLTDQVTRLYQAYFRRDPDADGLAYWRGQRAAGAPLTNVSDSFASSDEFIQRYGQLTNEQFVLQIYEDVLGRDPDAPGLAFWTSVLDGGVSRGAVMIGFSEAPEFVSHTGTSTPLDDQRLASLNRLYRSFFTRDGDSAGLTFWYDLLVRGEANLANTATSFASSTEFVQTYGTLPDEVFVELVYENVLDRPADVTGRAFWIAELARGVSRGEVMLAFSESAEFILKTDSLPPA